MIEIIYESVIYGYLYLQIIPALIGLLCFKKLDIYYKSFILILWFAILNEILASYYGTYISLNQNHIFYNIYNIIYFNFLFWLFYSKINKPILKNIIIINVILYFSSIVYELVFKEINYYTQTQVLPYIISGFGILISVSYYLMTFLTSNKQENLYINLLFWIAISHFIYYLGFIPLKIGENYFINFKQFNYLINLKIIITGLKSIILSVGFICSRQKVQS